MSIRLTLSMLANHVLSDLGLIPLSHMVDCWMSSLRLYHGVLQVLFNPSVIGFESYVYDSASNPVYTFVISFPQNHSPSTGSSFLL